MNGIAQQSTRMISRWMPVRNAFTGSLLLLALSLHTARAEPITIINSSFEDLRGKTPGYFGADGRLLNGKYTYAKAATSENGVFSFNPIPG